jgi:hypothetical protein
MKKHIYILHLEFGPDNWKTVIYSDRAVEDSYLKDTCELILKRTTEKWVEEHISKKKIEAKNSYLVNEILDVATHMKKSYIHEYVGLCGLHEMNYNIIHLEAEAETETKLLQP